MNITMNRSSKRNRKRPTRTARAQRTKKKTTHAPQRAGGVRAHFSRTACTKAADRRGGRSSSERAERTKLRRRLHDGHRTAVPPVGQSGGGISPYGYGATPITNPLFLQTPQHLQSVVAAAVQAWPADASVAQPLQQLMQILPQQLWQPISSSSTRSMVCSSWFRSSSAASADSAGTADAAAADSAVADAAAVRAQAVPSIGDTVPAAARREHRRSRIHRAVRAGDVGELTWRRLRARCRARHLTVLEGESTCQNRSSDRSRARRSGPESLPRDSGRFSRLSDLAAAQSASGRDSPVLPATDGTAFGPAFPQAGSSGVPSPGYVPPPRSHTDSVAE